MAPNTAGQWFALYVTSRHEKQVAWLLSQKRFESFLPLYKAERHWLKRKPVVLDLPLFPNYLFVRTEHPAKALAIAGVISIVGSPQNPWPLEDREIEMFRRAYSACQFEPHPGLVVGERVRVRAGALTGLEGVLLRRAGKVRFVVTIEAIHSSAAVEIEESNLEPATQSFRRLTDGPWAGPIVSGLAAVKSESGEALACRNAHQDRQGLSTSRGLRMRLASWILGFAVITLALQSASPRATAQAEEHGVTPPVASPSGGAESLHHRGPSYRIEAGDTFDVDFPITPTFNQTLAVEPDGYVTLKNIGSMEAQGKTVPQLTDDIRAAYSKILHEPIVTIALKDFQKPYFLAGGEIGKPGRYDLRGTLTVAQAVAIAGGFNENSKHSQVVLFRPTGNGMYESKVLDEKRLLKNHNLSEDVQLQPGDMIYVPQNKFSKIRRYLPTSQMGAYLNPVY